MLIDVKSIRDRPITINTTKLTQFLFPKIRNATHAFPVIIEPVARSPDLKSGLEKEKSMAASLKRTCGLFLKAQLLHL
jgi:hypothetical protein